MPSRRVPEAKGPDWSPEKTLRVLRQQLEQLEEIKVRGCLETMTLL